MGDTGLTIELTFRSGNAGPGVFHTLDGSLDLFALTGDSGATWGTNQTSALWPHAGIVSYSFTGREEVWGAPLDGAGTLAEIVNSDDFGMGFAVNLDYSMDAFNTGIVWGWKCQICYYTQQAEP